MGMRLYIYCVFIFSSFLLSKSTFDINLSDQFFTTEQKISQKEYHIAFLLPFCLENNSFLFSSNLDSLMINPDLLKDYDFYKKTKISIDFFLGFLFRPAKGGFMFFL